MAAVRAVCVMVALGCSPKRAPVPRDAKEPPTSPVEAPAARPEPPPGYVEMKPIGIIPTEQGNAALLVTDDGATFLPIFIGETEAASIQHRLDQRPPIRPLTHDLLDTVLKELGGELVKVHVRDLKDGIFFGAVFVRHGGKV